MFAIVSNPIATIVFYVLLSMAVNLVIWIGVYEMESSNQYFYYVFLDNDAYFSSGDGVLDGMINGLLLLAVIAVLSFALITCILYKFHRVVVFYIQISFAVLVYTLPAITIKDFFAKYFGFDDPIFVLMAVLTTALYLLFVAEALYTDHMPKVCQRIITVLNCSFGSVYYLRLLPRHTIWFLLIAIILWDLFAVKSKFGPLKLARQNAQDYNADLLRFILLTTTDDETSADDGDESTMKASEVDEDERDDDLTASTLTEDEEYCGNFIQWIFSDKDSSQSQDDDEEDESEKSGTSHQPRTAYEVLHDSNLTSLGLGDFVMYNVLVGKVAMSGSWLALILTIIGIIVGLVIALQWSMEEEERDAAYFPALPLSLIFGIAGYGFGFLASESFSIDVMNMPPLLKIVVVY